MSNKGKSSGDFVTLFKNLDIYTKVEADYKVQTNQGAFLSIMGWIIILILVLAEFNRYFTVITHEHMRVDTAIGDNLQINVDITFHALTCAEVHLDAMDVAGDNQINIEHDMIKQRLASDGTPIGKAGIELIGDVPESEPLPKDYCGPCYGAESEHFKCCNTCEELKHAYNEKGWMTNEIVRNSSQCLRDHDNPFAQVRTGEGCRLSGVMIVNKVAGNFHIALGDSIIRDGRHIHQFVPAEAPNFNITHTVHSISFGKPYPFMPANPLDLVSRTVEKEIGTGLFQYFIKVIPTTYVDERGYSLSTNQYTFTERFRPLMVPSSNPDTPAQMQASVIPGIFFVYELAPFVIEVTRTKVPLLHLFTRLLAVVGGVFSIMGVVDSFVFGVSKLTAKKH